MKEFKEYISEKLSINKDTKLSGTTDYELVGNILLMCGWNFHLNQAKEFIKKKEKEDDQLVKGIIKWVKNHDVISVDPYARYDNLREWGESEDIIHFFINDSRRVDSYDDYFVNERNFLVKIDGNDKSTQYEIYYNDKALLYRESDNEEFWAIRLFIKSK